MQPANNSMRRLPGGPGDATVQLAAGEAMLAGLDQTGAPAMRWYRFDPPALLLGSGQRSSDIDFDACRSAGIAVYRRGSGGGAVLGRSLVLLDLALPRSHPLYRADVTESYRWFGATWCDALRSLGLDASTVAIATARSDGARLDPLRRRVCFGGLSPYEVVVGGRKMVGLAQRRRKGGALFQAAAYLRCQPRATAELIAASPGERELLAAQLGERVVGLDACGLEASAPSVVAAVENALRAAGPFEIMADGWLPGEQGALATALERYAPLEMPEHKSPGSGRPITP